MKHKSRMLVITTAMLAVGTVQVPQRADAHTYHRMHRNFGAHAFAPRHPQGYGYTAPYRYYDRFGSNLNPDHQMVGIGE